MFNATELLGQILRSGMSRSAVDRLRHALGPEGLGQPGGPLGELGSRLAAHHGDAGGMLRGLAETARDFVGADQSGQRGNPLGDVGAAKGALGGGAVALLSGLALSALEGPQRASVTEQPAEEPLPLGLRAPCNPAEVDRLEHSATLILSAMINAAKADGQVDQEELQRIVGKLREAGAQAAAVDFVMSELKKPMDLDGLIREVPNEQVAVQLYAASLLAIEVDTEAERRYLRRLAHGLGLPAGVVQRVHRCLGMDHA